MQANSYLPDFVSHPGATLAEILEELKLGPKEFAVRTGKPEKTISKILNATSSITPDMAVLFEDVLKIPANFWLERQKKYDIFLARKKREEQIEAELEWGSNFPYAEMAKLGWITSTRKKKEKLEHIYDYFSVSSKAAFDAYYFQQKVPVSFRISLSNAKKPFAMAAWLRRGELQAEELSAPPFNKSTLKSVLPELKNIMANHPSNFFNRIQEVCLKAGVKVVYTPCLPGASVHGSTRWVKDTPLVQLSARYKQNDIFWFTFFHEIGHILFHGKKFVSMENVDYDEEEELKEKEADKFAVEWTFSEAEEKEVLSKKPLFVEDIEMFAKKFGTHPAMIIGRFHFKKLLPYSLGREFIQSINLSD